MLVSGMLFSCTNNTQSEEVATDSTAVVQEASVAPVEEETTEVVETEVSSDTVATEGTVEVK